MEGHAPKMFWISLQKQWGAFFFGFSVILFNSFFQKKKKIVPKYKHNHIIDDDSSSTFDFRTVNVKENCTLSPS